MPKLTHAVSPSASHREARVIKIDGDTLKQAILDMALQLSPNLDGRTVSIMFWPSEVGSKCSADCEVTIGYLEKAES